MLIILSEYIDNKITLAIPLNIIKSHTAENVNLQ